MCLDTAAYGGYLDVNISKVDKGYGWRMKRPRDNRLIDEANGFISQIRRWISSDVNSGGIQVSRRP